MPFSSSPQLPPIPAAPQAQQQHWPYPYTLRQYPLPCPPGWTSPQQTSSVPVQTQTVSDSANVTKDYLRQLLRVSDVDIKDIFHVLGRRHQVPIAKHQKTNALVTTTQFQRWIISPTSCELLVHGEFKGKEPHYVSALSVFSANLVRALRWRERFVSLVFFCGNHVEDDDQPLGGRAMIRSFTVQLLRHSSLDDVLRDHPVEVDEERIRKGNIAHLCALFSWLIHRLPKYFVVVCIIEGI